MQRPAGRFEGAEARIGLPDAIQLNGLGGFSGCIAVSAGVNTGFIFFRDGQLIHAEAGDRAGEPAFHEIMRWAESSFTLQPNVTTTRHTIEGSWKSLLAESVRLRDEAREDGRVPTGGTREVTLVRPAAREKLVGLVDKIRRIPGVLQATLQTKEQPGVSRLVDPEGFEGQTVALATFGKRMGELFRTGESMAASIQGSESNLLLLATKNFRLSILIQGGTQASAVEAEIRKLVASTR